MRTLFLTVSVLALSACSSIKQAEVTRLWSSDRVAPVLQYGASDGFGSGGVHTVMAGDHLTKIAKRYHVGMDDIIALNDLGADQALRPGMRLRLPPPRTYAVRPGDQLGTIARTFAVDRMELASINNLVAPFRLNPGQKLTLPRPSIAALAEEMVAVSSPVPPVVTAELPPRPVVDLPPEGYQVASRGGMMVVPNRKPSIVQASLPEAVPPEWQSFKDSTAAFLMPVRGPVISGFGPKKDGRVNDGVNIAAPKGTPVRAARDGQVVYVGDAVTGYGNLVLIKHAGGYVTAYAHLDRMVVQDGMAVKRGQVIGTVGSSGNVDRAQLHFEIRKGRDAVDPKGMI